MQNDRNSAEYQRWRRDVKQRDGGACRVCRFQRNIHVHHIKPLERYPDFATELDNGITLCGNHHALLKDKEESTNLQTVIEAVTGQTDMQTTNQLKRLNDKFCNYLINLLGSKDQHTKLNTVFQSLNHIQIYPESVEQFLPFIQRLLNDENETDQGLTKRMVVEFFERNPSGVVSQVVRKYKEQIEAEKYRQDAEPEELKRLRLLAEQDDAAVRWYILGWSYANGRDVVQNDDEAVKWYRKAAERGHAIAQYDLGWMYQYGRGVNRNRSEAIKWFQKAAEQGYTDAQNNLGWSYWIGNRGVLKFDEEAVKWYRKAAKQGHPDAQNNLGWMYINGRGVNRNRSEAVKWFQKAAKQGHEAAQENLKRYHTDVSHTS